MNSLINKGAIIGAKSLVDKEIPEYAIYAGIPFKENCKRF